MNSKKPRVFCLMGPTGIGKSNLAIHWASEYNCDIISVDSAQIYREMDIGTAKPDKETLMLCPHRLINIRYPTEIYSVADFIKEAREEIEISLSKNRIPLLVGGTMLYFKALQEGLSDLPPSNTELRNSLTERIEKEGLKALYEKLSSIDPLSAQKIKPGDSQRILRALEIYEITGTPMSDLQKNKRLVNSYDFINIGLLSQDRVFLHEKIKKRFNTMIKQGFIEEVEALKKNKILNLTFPSMRAVGYRQIWQYLEGEFSKAEMIEKSLAATRQLAKRQMTWLRSWEAIKIYDPLEVEPKSIFMA